MTSKELEQLQKIANDKGWLTQKQLKEFLKTVEVTEEVKAQRTSAQNRALHLWFTQVSQACQNEGVEAQMVFAKTSHMAMTPEAVKYMWKALQKALFKTKSTTQLKKSGEIEQLQDHFVRFFAENFGLELPPFPNEEFNVRLTAMENLKREDYPKYKGSPTI